MPLLFHFHYYYAMFSPFIICAFLRCKDIFFIIFIIIFIIIIFIDDTDDIIFMLSSFTLCHFIFLTLTLFFLSMWHHFLSMWDYRYLQRCAVDAVSMITFFFFISSSFLFFLFRCESPFLRLISSLSMFSSIFEVIIIDVARHFLHYYYFSCHDYFLSMPLLCWHTLLLLRHYYFISIIFDAIFVDACRSHYRNITLIISFSSLHFRFSSRELFIMCRLLSIDYWFLLHFRYHFFAADCLISSASTWGEVWWFSITVGALFLIDFLLCFRFPDSNVCGGLFSSLFRWYFLHFFDAVCISLRWCRYASWLIISPWGLIIFFLCRRFFSSFSLLSIFADFLRRLLMIITIAVFHFDVASDFLSSSFSFFIFRYAVFIFFRLSFHYVFFASFRLM